MDDQGAREYCRKCGAEVFSFSTKRAESDGLSYCVKCAERADSKYIAENTCSVCTRLLSKGEARFLLASRLYSEERLPMAERMVCSGCYSKVATSTRSRMEFASKARRIRESIRKSLVKRMFAAKSYSLSEAQ